MAIYLKDPATEADVRSFAAENGLSVTAAIKHAVAEARARKEAARQLEIERRIAVVREIQERVAARGGLPTMEEIDDWLYDEDGMPH